MNIDELVRRCEERLNHTSTPSLPPEETLKAILELDKERWRQFDSADKLGCEITKLRKELSICKDDIKKLNAKLVEEKNKLEEQSWIATEFGEFIRNIANHQFDGQESAAAKRVYDLNKDSITKPLLNCYLYTSLEKAKNGYKKYCSEMGFAFDEINMLEWLYNVVER